MFKPQHLPLLQFISNNDEFSALIVDLRHASEPLQSIVNGWSDGPAIFAYEHPASPLQSNRQSIS